MDSTMFQLRSFVHQRLYAAAEEIFGEVEKTITLALYEAEASRSKKKVGSLRRQLDLLQQKSVAEEPSLSCSTVEQGTQYAGLSQQESPGPSRPEECRFSVSAEVPWNCQTSTDDNKNNCIMETVFKVAEIKMEQEEVGVDSEEQKLHIPAPNVVTSEQDQPTIQEEPHEMRADSSDCSEGPTEDSDSYDEDLEEQRGKLLQAKSGCVAQDDKFNTNNQKSRNFCRFCGKGFQYVAALMRHIKTHDKNTDCAVCGKASRTTAELLAHLKRHHSKVDFCNICGETFPNVHFLRLHEKKHTGEKDFTCRECGRVFNRRHHLIVHVRSHSGEKPYHCDICGKGFSQSQNVKIHKIIHSGERPHQCGVCGKLFPTNSKLKTHMRYHTGEKPFSCDICGKRFYQKGQMTRHKTTHSE